jgi:alkylated DNA nucleotide flippase Atl1
VAVFSTPGEYTERVLDIVASIPPGRVMTYGDVAAVFGRPGARAVGMVLRYSGGGLPWWRVIRSGGHPPVGKAAEARVEYEREGTPLLPASSDDGYRIDYDCAAWSP